MEMGHLSSHRFPWLFSYQTHRSLFRRLIAFSIVLAWLGMELGWHLNRLKQPKPLDPVAEKFARHLQVQKLARDVLPERPHPKAYATMEWRIPDGEN